ncbi:MAG TPA: helix-turn-helix transcriptional regulator [Candidatus Kapabacteria bacterium]|jgi:AraC-like DNA-binding protein|nr:helix-turn-helix transcriptional regulator [Candidatus Kapabacteria bacterium]
MDNNQVSRTNNWEVLAAESNYCPSELARLCHVSLRTLQRRFATNYGMTISDWMRQIRLAKAYARVVSGEPIKAVAYDLGFKQLSHFSRVFKEVHGVAPSLVSPRGRAKAALAGQNPSPFPAGAPIFVMHERSAATSIPIVQQALPLPSVAV